MPHAVSTHSHTHHTCHTCVPLHNTRFASMVQGGHQINHQSPAIANMNRTRAASTRQPSRGRRYGSGTWCNLPPNQSSIAINRKYEPTTGRINRPVAADTVAARGVVCHQINNQSPSIANMNRPRAASTVPWPQVYGTWCSLPPNQSSIAIHRKDEPTTGRINRPVAADTVAARGVVCHQINNQSPSIANMNRPRAASTVPWPQIR